MTNGGPASGSQMNMACPWHKMGREHPNLSPECYVMPENLAAGRVVPLGHIVSWMAITLTETAQVVSEMFMYHLAEHGDEEGQEMARVAFAERDARDAEVESLEELATQELAPGEDDES